MPVHEFFARLSEALRDHPTHVRSAGDRRKVPGVRQWPRGSHVQPLRQDVEEELSLGGGGPLKRLTKLVTALRLLFAGAFLVGAIVLLELGSRWATRWQPHAVKQSGIFCYRGVVRGLRTAPDEGS
jgi:hypothetical protein